MDYLLTMKTQKGKFFTTQVYPYFAILSIVALGRFSGPVILIKHVCKQEKTWYQREIVKSTFDIKNGQDLILPTQRKWYLSVPIDLGNK